MHIILSTFSSEVRPLESPLFHSAVVGPHLPFLLVFGEAKTYWEGKGRKSVGGAQINAATTKTLGVYE